MSLNNCINSLDNYRNWIAKVVVEGYTHYSAKLRLVEFRKT